MRRMRSPSRAVPVLALACVLSACSVWDGKDEPTPLEPSAISPDSVVTCQDNGDCGQAGAVRWSRPLEGDFYLKQSEESAPVLLPAQRWLDYGYPLPGAVEADGVLYLHAADTVVAVDTLTATTLWTEPMDGDVAMLRWVGRTLVVSSGAHGDEDTLHFLEVDRDGAQVRRSQLPQDLEQEGVVAFDDTYLALREDLPFSSEDDPRYFLVEADTGRVVWSERLAAADSHAMADGTLYLEYSPREGEAHVSVVTGGEPVAEFATPRQAGREGQVWVVPEGPLLFDTPGCALGEKDRCGKDRITAVDPLDGKVWWSHPVPAEIVSVFAGPKPRVFVQEQDGYRALDARTGRLVAQDGEIDPVDLLAAYGAQPQEPPGEEAMSLEDYQMLALRPTGPGVDADLLEGLAAGARHLTSYPGPDGGVVGVYTGCAPNGLRPAAMDAPTGGTTCVAPRLFAVDY